jgi:hypothetical protein
MATERDEDRAREQAQAQVESICDMVAALECDYDRLTELCDEQASWEHGPEDWIEANPDLASELADLQSAAGDCESQEDAGQRIDEDPLSIEVRSDWHAPGADDEGPSEYLILLCTGGPAVRIVGDLGPYCQPSSARVEYQDWFTPWTELVDITSEQREALLTYASHFYYGE